MNEWLVKTRQVRGGLFRIEYKFCLPRRVNAKHGVQPEQAVATQIQVCFRRGIWQPAMRAVLLRLSGHT